MIDFPDIEDKDNWHGKPLGDKGDAIIKAFKAKLQNLKVEPKSASGSLPEVDLSVHLSEPPSYQLGDKVFHRAL